MEKIQKDINPSMRAILIDWLVEVIFLESICQFLHYDPFVVQNVTLLFVNENIEMIHLFRKHRVSM
jgi:hypothetical protein